MPIVRTKRGEDRGAIVVLCLVALVCLAPSVRALVTRTEFDVPTTVAFVIGVLALAELAITLLRGKRA